MTAPTHDQGGTTAHADQVTVMVRHTNNGIHMWSCSAGCYSSRWYTSQAGAQREADAHLAGHAHDATEAELADVFRADDPAGDFPCCAMAANSPKRPMDTSGVSEARTEGSSGSRASNFERYLAERLQEPGLRAGYEAKKAEYDTADAINAAHNRGSRS